MILQEADFWSYFDAYHVQRKVSSCYKKCQLRSNEFN